ncbi:MAG TPA: ATP-binding cassette domain-containing protein, partial [Bacillota bacterium]|nr:ATP-binding cassette domain-containing protein [Bacillota bacterium]
RDLALIKVKASSERRSDVVDIVDIFRAKIVDINRETTVIGPSGAGKSTLLRVLNLLQKPSGGQISFYGKPLLDPHLHREHQTSMTMVFQKPALFAGTVSYNVALGLRLKGCDKAEQEQRVARALDMVGLGDFGSAHVSTLSGGEAQRVALARALVLRPQVLLLDEPTANLDPANVRIFEEVLRQSHEELGNTILIVTHNFHQARRLSQQTIFLDSGRLVEFQETDSLFTDPKEVATKAFLNGEMIY